ncbi:hypothetical protein, partial [Streptococcus suis]|uniref:hypothetical protein n=1 Tax=Streptococcus suis TaxID=1307 RepID=UPI003A5BAEE7
DFETRRIVTILENNRQANIKNYFYMYPRAVRETVEVVTMLCLDHTPNCSPFALLSLGSG